ncbi:hypothetical protein ACFWN2_06615 [Lentzea sp. NPDC058436]|uniref:hypothetical protein n=1 Tax=Lentzea sp. NPDC058436 TaxID=3346499 RepID=UPI00366A3A0D
MNEPAAPDVPAEGDRGSSTYATGGGGVSFAHRVATVYLADMLVGARRPEASELPVRKVSFQTGPAHPVDDLLVECGDESAEVRLAVACRATPNFVESHKDTVKLVGSLLAEVAKFAEDTLQVVVAVAGWNNQWGQLATLCDVARAHADSGAFQAAMNVDQRWSAKVRDRLTQLKKMIAKSAGTGTESSETLGLAWGLLRRLHLLGFAVQSPDQADRTRVATSLDGVASADTDGVAIRNRIEVEATRYDMTGAVVDLGLLRRDLHQLLDATSTRNRRVWAVVDEHRKLAVASVRTTIGEESSGEAVTIPFAERRRRLALELSIVGTSEAALVIVGESGVGKSALMLSAIAALEQAEPTGFEALVVNLRRLPQTSLELSTAFGKPMEEVLAELSALRRVLVIDAADAVLEHSAALFNDLVRAAANAGVGVAAVTADSASGFVSEQLQSILGKPARSFTMEPLTDEEISVVSDGLPLLRAVLRDLPANSLFRRPVVLDLLARTGAVPESSLGEWDCLQLVWSKVVCGDGRPGVGSAEARQQTLLAVAASVMRLPANWRPVGGIDAAAVDALRRDHLLAPASPYQEFPEFAHDEVRRYATAILLVRSRRPTELLEAAGVPRWALSAGTLACKGLLKAPDVRPADCFVQLLSQFVPFSAAHGSRWADVPVEAVLEMPFAYDCLEVALDDHSAGLVLGDVVRVVQQRHKVKALIDPVVSAPVVRILLADAEPWKVSNASFELLTDWMLALVMAATPAGNELRIRLRERLLACWEAFPPRDTSGGAGSKGIPGQHRHLRKLDQHLTNAKFVETLALLGPDIDDAVEVCLRAVADDAPASLAPAADSPWSSRALTQRSPELLAELMEAYYIDNGRHGYRDEGVRRHQGRWHSAWPPFAQHWFGGFWALFQTALFTTSARVLNNILNRGAHARVQRGSRRHSLGFLGDLDGGAGNAEDARGAVMNLDGTARLYAGDTHVWCWYRGTTVGPYPAMSALQAMERFADDLLAHGVPLRRIVEVLLEGCDNLATPGMLFGLLVRHLENVDDELDVFFADPVVWELEFARVTHEHSGLRASTEGLANLDRRAWTPHHVAAQLALRGGQPRAEALKEVADKLVQNGDRLGISPEDTRSWATGLDHSRYQLVNHGQQQYLEVVLPPELEALRDARRAEQAVVQTVLRLQNRYWGAAKFDVDYVPPSPAEIAADLKVGRSLIESDGESPWIRPLNGVAQVVREAVQRAAAGDMEALGDEGRFATEFVLETALSFRDAEDQRHDAQYFDHGADRAVAEALPAFITPTMTPLVENVGATNEDVDMAGLAMAGRGSPETRLYLARGCDVVWASPCHREPCNHRIALNWLIETARAAELAPWGEYDQVRPEVTIEGDLARRLQELDTELVDIDALDPAIRGLGAAAAADHCCSSDTGTLLAVFLDVQRRAMVDQEALEWSADDRGTHTLVAARALLTGFAKSGDTSPLLQHLDVLRADAGLMANFLHGLAAAGAENERLAGAARGIWPSLLRHAIGYLGDVSSPYEDRHWGDWAAAALLPEPLTWARGLYNEIVGLPIDWVVAEDLVELIDGWLPAARGKRKGVDALIGTLRRLPATVQVRRGVPWVSDLCIQGGVVAVKQSILSNEWLEEIRRPAEELGRLAEWQTLVDSMVVAGNERLARHSK